MNTIILNHKVTLASLDMFVQELINEYGLGAPIHISGQIEFPDHETNIGKISLKGDIQLLPRPRKED